ncbi:hypothetical protein [Paraburkholderia sp. UYCP14C]|uniref:hypothetical protein n=1 Tax=Paraburkholderia sp. UYCP14C TaxID=2511130 RepID=UPI00102097B5|nr:hypothetical protein [Paraburkholderia sp. UYCP14C]
MLEVPFAPGTRACSISIRMTRAVCGRAIVRVQRRRPFDVVATAESVDGRQILPGPQVVDDTHLTRSVGARDCMTGGIPLDAEFPCDRRSSQVVVLEELERTLANHRHESHLAQSAANTKAQSARARPPSTRAPIKPGSSTPPEQLHGRAHRLEQIRIKSSATPVRRRRAQDVVARYVATHERADHAIKRGPLAWLFAGCTLVEQVRQRRRQYLAQVVRSIAHDAARTASIKSPGSGLLHIHASCARRASSTEIEPSWRPFMSRSTMCPVAGK